MNSNLSQALGLRLPARLLVPLLIMGILFQLAVVLVEWRGAFWPIWTGKSVILSTRPVDPRSLFRGDFVDLNYDISTVSADIYQGDTSPKRNQVVFLSLQEENGVWRAHQLFDAEPSAGIFLRARVKHSGTSIGLQYGLEAFFLPRSKARELELPGRVDHVRIMVDASGKSRPVELLCLADDCTEM